MAESRVLSIDLVVEGDATPLDEQELLRLVEASLACYGLADGMVDVGVRFATPRAMAALNRDHRAVDAPTDVLSFPIDGADPLPDGIARQLGDVVVCVEHVERQLGEGHSMGEHDTTLDAAIRRCVVHGLLHLLGERHDDDAAASAMHDAEDRILRVASGSP